MFELLINKSTLYAKKRGVAAAISGIKEVNDLDEGAIAVFTNKQELVTAANASTIFENRTGFFIALGGNQTTIPVTISELVDRNQVISYLEQAYIAPVKQVIAVGVADIETNDGIGTIVAGDYAYMRIVDRSEGTIPVDTIERYEYKIKAGDTASAIFQSFVAQINARVGGLGTAVIKSGTFDGFKYTVAEFGKTVEITFDGVASDIPVDYTNTSNGAVIINYGSGSPSHVATIEEEYSPILGNTNKIFQSGQWFKRPSRVDSAVTYILFTLCHQGVKQGAITTQNTLKKQMVIAIPTGATQLSVFRTAMTAALAEQNAVFNGIES